jgi:small-conductance mechanosensitive channel
MTPEEIAKLNLEELARLDMKEMVDSDTVMMGLSIGGIFLAIAFSLIGFLYFRYGKKNAELSTMITGGVLMGYTYFVTKTLYILLVGLGIMGAHFYLQKKQ